MRVPLILRQRGDVSGGLDPERHAYKNGRRPTAFALSCLIHVVVIGTAVMLDPLSSARRATPTLYDQVIAPNEKKLVWYHVKELPRIDPVKKIGDSATPQGEEKRNDVIINVAPDAERAHQLVLRHDVEKPLVKETPAPNLVAVAAEPEKQKTRKTFQPPPAPAAELQKAKISAPPEPAPAPRAQLGTGLETMIKALPKMRRAFVPPPVAPTTVRVRSDLPDFTAPQPEMRPGAGSPVNGALDNALGKSMARLPNRPFVAPTAGKQSAGRGSIAVPEPDSGPTGQVTIAVLSTSPLRELVGALPEGVRPADISAAPKVGPRSTGNTGREGPQIPGLVLIPGRQPPLPAPANTGPPVYEETRVVAARSTLSAPLRPSSRTIPRSIEAKFHDRTVYTMVVPMPRLPMYAGDWIMWFAERGETPGAGLQMRAPLPMRKFGLVSDRPEAKPSGRIQLSATILKNGQLDSVQLLDKSLSDSKQAAIADFQHWQFSPAVRDGVPVDVEIIIEIPYQ